MTPLALAHLIALAVLLTGITVKEGHTVRGYGWVAVLAVYVLSGVALAVTA